MAYGAATGGGVGALTAGLSGQDVWAGFIGGAVGGGLFGGIGGYRYAKNMGYNPWTGGLADTPEMLQSNLVPNTDFFQRRELGSQRFGLDDVVDEDFSVFTYDYPTAIEATPIQGHHIFSQRQDLAEKFVEQGIDIHDYIMPLPRRVYIGSTGIHGGGARGGNWNKAWQDFFDLNPMANDKDIYKQLGKMLYDFDLNQAQINIKILY